MSARSMSRPARKQRYLVSWGRCALLRPTVIGLGVFCGLLIPSANVHAQENNAPVATAATYESLPGMTFSITLTGTDADSDPLTFIITALPATGTVVSSPDTLTADDLPYTASTATITYTTDDPDTGSKTLQFKVSDGTDESTVAATITIIVWNAPEATGETFVTEPDTDLKFDLPVEDGDGGVLEYTISSLPGHGRLKTGSTTLTDEGIPYETTQSAFTYTPDANYHGSDSFTCSASDGSNDSGSITATIEVNTTPVPDDLEITVLPDSSATITLTSTDADRDYVTYTIASVPDHGTLTLAGAIILAESIPLTLGSGMTDIVYTVDPSYRGTDSFHYRVADGVSESDRAVVTISVNTPPVASDSNLAVDPLGTVEGLLTPVDANGDAITVRLVEMPQYGSLKVDSRSVTNTSTIFDVPGTGLPIEYTADSETESSDFFTWVANDGKEDSSTARVNITVLVPEDDTTDDSDSDSADGDEQVLSDEPDEIAMFDCGSAGAAELGVMALTLLIAPVRRFRRTIGNTAANRIVYKQCRLPRPFRGGRQ